MTPEHWRDPRARCVGLLLDGRAQTSGINRRGSEATLLLILNANPDLVLFTLPEVRADRDRLRLLDTGLPEEDDDPDAPVCLSFGHKYDVTDRSLLLFLVRPERRRVPRWTPPVHRLRRFGFRWRLAIFWRNGIAIPASPPALRVPEPIRVDGIAVGSRLLGSAECCTMPKPVG